MRRRRGWAGPGAALQATAATRAPEVTRYSSAGRGAGGQDVPTFLFVSGSVSGLDGVLPLRSAQQHLPVVVALISSHV